MASLKTVCVAILLLAVFTMQASACGRRRTDDEDSASNDNDSTDTGGDDSDSSTTANACCVCGQPVNVHLIVNNQIKEPFFTFQTEVNGMPQQQLMKMLESAAVQDEHFRFSADYFGTLGYMVSTLNGLSANVADKTYWKLVEGENGTSLALGLSHYMPMHEELIMFNFTSWG